jgi:predicted short-subunit dehydrogenase-like oxidoreductase (DUF2520 family)
VRQVPDIDVPPFGIVGTGRVARHFQHYFSLLGLPIRAWSRHATGGLLETLAPCDTVLILIPDRAIVSFVETWPALQRKRLVHCSGSLVTPLAEGAHPLMTFGPYLYDLDTYREIPFILDAGRTPLAQLLPGLPNPSFVIPATERAYYHALCVMAGNFSTILWNKLFDELQERFGIPAEAAHPYLARVTANLMRDAHQALTGPLVRGDVQAIAANLEALEGDRFHVVYSGFLKAYEQRS